ncbi:MoaD/ThiS family protein [Geomonas subterranea]|uniref:MoaD/ThiS family protein n=1 Tax=Geomonas subterranea TaxID=2847989 RepID=A0ABX8LN95_9BACT|nr:MULTISPECIES: MoaD/ThiS family protein [Geomonas]QXE92099.1 MoaD/ThiS family protein [Geomonas subterranea]QXM09806.1 MoaD/ThiS family protein [Geomonas subterranea]
MKVTVKLFAHYRIGRFKVSVREYAPGTSVRTGIAELKFADPGPGVVLINGAPATLDHVLKDGDTLALFPLVSGG